MTAFTLTYGNLLALFIVVPLLMLTLLLWHDRQRKQPLPADLRGWRFPLVLLALVVMAVVYTTLWDNHLIAIQVWWYDPRRIFGVTLGFVPFEELSFFVLQTLLVGLWLFWLIRRSSYQIPPAISATKSRMRWLSAGLAAGLWMVGLAVLVSGWRAGTYLGWELVWALPPIILQLAIGADILWGRRRLLVVASLPLLFYLSLVDALAIHQGIWTINPHQSLDILIGGQLPLEEFVFFLLTTALLSFGFLLGLSTLAKQRLLTYFRGK